MHKQVNECMDKQTNEKQPWEWVMKVEGWMNELMHTKLDGYIDEWLYEYMNKGLHEMKNGDWTDRQMDGYRWLGGFQGRGWVYIHMDGEVHTWGKVNGSGDVDESVGEYTGK